MYGKRKIFRNKGIRMKGIGLIILCVLGGSLFCIFPSAPAARDDDLSSETTHVFFLKHRVLDMPFHTISFKLGSTGVDFKNLPPFEGKDIIQGMIVIDEKQNIGIPLAWDRSFNKLYIDRNRNLDLTDDPDNVYTGDKKYNTCTYKNLHLDITRNDINIPCVCTLTLARSFRKWDAALEINSVWESGAELSGDSWLLDISDGMDGIVGNSAHDRITIIPRAGFPAEQTESLPFPENLLFLQNKAYKMNCSFIREGDETLLKTEFLETEPECGEMRITGKYISLLILSGENQVILTSPTQTVLIPSGLYREQRLLLQNPGHERTLPLSLKKNINIDGKNPYEFKDGGPLRNSMDIKRSGNRLIMNYKLLDAGNNQIENEWTDANQIPTLIVYQNGKKVHADKFNYG
jgi:hypothetical protein